MDATRNLELPYLMPSQAQKHVTHNEALRMLDAIVHLSVLDRTLATPPLEPADGARYLIPSAPTGDWQHHEGEIAAFQDGAWAFFTPLAGWLCFVANERTLLVFDGATWTTVAGASPEPGILDRLGLRTEADVINPFAARLNNAIWTADYTGDGGSGDLRYVMNKEQASGTLSLLMQTDWSGRAEIGLVGTDDLTMKVSANGDDWHEALRIENETGRIAAPQGLADAITGLSSPLYVPAPVVSDIWRCDASRSATPRTYTMTGVSGTTITLGSAVAGVNGQFGRWNTMSGTKIRVWNTSKVPAQSAWVMGSPTTTTLTVTDAAHIASWSNGDTLRVGDPNPTGDNTLNMVALDIGAYLDTTFGLTFPQKGLFLSLYVSSTDGPAGLDFSPNGAGGSAIGGNALSNGSRNQTSLPLPTPVPSPISNSNLLLFREQLAGATDIGVTVARVLGIYV